MAKLLILLGLIALSYSKSIKQSASAIEDLEIYIEEKKQHINQRYRPLYHVAGPVGWINDPNGFSYYKGDYHLFYQYYPYDSVWGPMHWGHASSPDLVNWKQLPTALLPEKEQCFSGSAVVDNDTLILIYTGHELSDIDPFYNQTQFLAFSEDGVTFKKYDGNPVIPFEPNGSPDFRDPKAWRHGDHWYVIIGSKTDDDRGRVLLYRSEDMINWEYLNILAESDGSLGFMWECPDFFEIDGKFILLMSPQGIDPQGDRYKNLYQTGYIVGSFSYETFEFTPEVGFQELDFGHDFYAAQTTEHDGKRYLIGWFNMWENPMPENQDGWSGLMTVVRELKLVDNRLRMTPLEKMYDLRDNMVWKGAFRYQEEVTLDKTADIVFQGNLNEEILLQIEGADGGQKVWVRWDPDGHVSVEKEHGDFRRVEWEYKDNTDWRLLLDASSLELFCGAGEVVFSSRVYPAGGWNVINLSSQTLDIEAYTLKRSVPV